MNFIFRYIKGDKGIWVVVFLLSVFSILAVYSSIVTLAYKYQGGDTFFYLFKHAIILGIGLFLMIIAHNLKFKYYSRISQIALILAIPLLVLTMITGANINEASRWLVIPVINQTFQTSDLAKLALIMYLARFLSKHQDNIGSFKEAFLPVIIPVGIVCLLILPSNFSTAAMLFVTCLIIMFIGRISIKYILAVIGLGIVTLFIGLLIGKFYPDVLPRLGTWQKRIEAYQGEGSKDANYQSEQAKIAIATGGVIGKGPGGSTQRNFLPHPYSDFIYAIIIEEYGMVGGVIIIFLYLVLFYRGIRIASKSEQTFGSLLAIGLSFSLVFQALINMAVAVSLFPVTGQPLPLVSMGGTSIWFTCLAIGIILSVSRENENLGNTSKTSVAS
ncbi:MAG: FtsW/RodA/SpoVE family cell cycle protein [Flavobacteriales bacterium]|nr:FtsW/RodA/SpoVE family cell cycle protein [Flavobacteriales bacterium]